MLDLSLTRRSYRKFGDKAMGAEKEEELLQTARLGPTRKSTRPWGFVVVGKKEALQRLGDCRQSNQLFLPKTPLAIVVLDSTRETGTRIEDASITAVIMQLEAEKLGLGSYWVQIRLGEPNQGISSEGYVRKLLGIPEHMAVFSIIAVGYPGGTMPAHQLDEADQAKVHTGTY